MNPLSFKRVLLIISSYPELLPDYKTSYNH